jgi:hypothetical protein
MIRLRAAMLLAVFVSAYAAPSLGQEDLADDADLIDPRRTWSCVVYGNPALGDERVLLNFAPDQSTLTAKPSPDANRPWSPLSQWSIEDETLSFSDSRSGRNYQANLRRSTLGGEWRTLNLLGGWWCSKATEKVELSIFADTDGGSRNVLVPLIPARMASPSYPRLAIREATEGRVVICFEVESSGGVLNPEFVELSDEIFRATSLDALMSSSYQPWSQSSDQLTRPACRSFVYSLEYTF